MPITSRPCRRGPNRPCGRKNSTSISSRNGTARLVAGGNGQDGKILRKPHGKTADDRADQASGAAQDSGRQHRQQQIEAHVRAQLHRHAEKYAGRRCQRFR